MSEIIPAAPILDAAPVEEVSSEANENQEGSENLEASPEEVNSEEGSKPEPKKEAKPKDNIQTFEVKVNGKIKSVKVDMNNPESIKKYIELAEGAQEKFQESASIKKQVDALIRDLRANPIKVLSDPALGHDFKKLAVEFLENELKALEMSPEQKKLKDMEDQLKAFEEEKKKLSEEKTQAELERARQQATQLFDDELNDALKGTDLPKSPYVVKRVADTLVEALAITDDAGNALYPNITVKDIMPFVRQQIKQELKDLMASSGDDAVEELLGKQRIDNMRKAKIAKAAKPVVNKVQDSGKIEAKPKEEAKIPFSKFFNPF